jgi:prepilin-type N-terminal cleavage/methylation domain-containing protein
VNRTRCQGYTFIELTVVLVIILTVAAIGMPRLLSWVNEGNLGAAGRQLAGTIRYVRNEAARRQKPFYLAVDLEQNAYWIEVRRDPHATDEAEYSPSWDESANEGFVPFEDEFVARQELRKLIVFDRIVFDDMTDERFGTVRIPFWPDGTTQTVAIHLKNTQNLVTTVVLDGDTGRVEVYDYDFDLQPPPVLYEQYDESE